MICEANCKTDVCQTSVSHINFSLQLVFYAWQQIGDCDWEAFKKHQQKLQVSETNGKGMCYLS